MSTPITPSDAAAVKNESPSAEPIPHVTVTPTLTPGTLAAAQRIAFGDEEPGDRWDGQS